MQSPPSQHHYQRHSSHKSRIHRSHSSLYQYFRDLNHVVGSYFNLQCSNGNLPVRGIRAVRFYITDYEYFFVKIIRRAVSFHVLITIMTPIKIISCRIKFSHSIHPFHTDENSSNLASLRFMPPSFNTYILVVIEIHTFRGSCSMICIILFIFGFVWSNLLIIRTVLYTVEYVDTQCW